MDPYSRQQNQAYQPQGNEEHLVQSGNTTAVGYVQGTGTVITPQGFQPTVPTIQPPGAFQSVQSVQPIQATGYGQSPYGGQPPQQFTAGYEQPVNQALYGAYGQSQYQGYPNQYPSSGYAGAKRQLPFKNKLILGFVGIALLVAGIFGIRSLSAQSPNDVFMTALENQLKLKTMHVVLSSSTPKLNATTKVNYYVDLQDPSAPKSAGTIENSSAFLRTKIEVAAEFNAQSKDVYTRFTNPAYASWVVTTETDESLLNSSKAANLSLIRDLALNANSVQGIILSGNFSKELRNSTVKAYKDKSPYTIVSSEEVKEENDTVRKYVVTLNKNVVNELQKSVTESLGLLYTPISEGDKSYSFFVDTKRKLVTKIEQTDADNTYTLTFSEQNKSFQTAPPETSVTADAYLAQLQ